LSYSFQNLVRGKDREFLCDTEKLFSFFKKLKAFGAKDAELFQKALE